MRPRFDKVQNTNKLLFKTLIVAVLATVILNMIDVIADKSSTRMVSTITPVANEDAVANTLSAEEVAHICSLRDIDCGESTKAPVSADTTLVAHPVAPQRNGEIAVPADLKKIFKGVCLEKGFTGDDCWKTLSAMAWTESRFDCTAKGDWTKRAGYRSHGCFQIQTEMHKVTIKQAQDPRFAATWTLNRLIAKGYPEYKTASIKAHNGAGPMAQKYASKVKYHMAIIK